MKHLDYHFLKYNLSAGPRWVGIAWDNNGSGLISTKDHASYTEAREELGNAAEKFDCTLKYFQGEFEVGSNGIYLT